MTTKRYRVVEAVRLLGLKRPTVQYLMNAGAFVPVQRATGPGTDHFLDFANLVQLAIARELNVFLAVPAVGAILSRLQAEGVLRALADRGTRAALPVLCVVIEGRGVSGQGGWAAAAANAFHLMPFEVQIGGHRMSVDVSLTSPDDVAARLGTGMLAAVCNVKTLVERLEDQTGDGL